MTLTICSAVDLTDTELEESKTLYELYERLRVHEERDVGAWNSTMKTILTRTGYEFSVGQSCLLVPVLLSSFFKRSLIGMRFFPDRM